MDNRREFLKKAALLSGGLGLAGVLPASIQKALAINPAPGSTWQDAEHVVFLMQENRSFDHCYAALQGVRGFNNPRAVRLPNGNPVWLQTAADGETYAPFRLGMHNTKSTWMGGLPHSWTDQVDARNDGRYDQWLIAKQYGSEEHKNLPMALGYYTREDLPFYYALADAFTVCDQHFSSSLTGTTPNRLYFWSGAIREDANAKARVWNGDTTYEKNAAWTTYPERLEQAGISWRIYQNELSVGAGFTPEEDAWLANFTDNPLEWFAQYHVKLSPTYIAYLQIAPDRIAAEISQLEKELATATGKKAEALQRQIGRKKQSLERVLAEQKIYTKEQYEGLPAFEKSLHDKAFTTNRLDPFYHELTNFKYKDGNEERELVIPKGDILHQFRKDVTEGGLPTVSWLVAPEKFSDHPSAPWYGAWYVSEVLDILTKNPEVWKKTIFLLTYDENDGYFDHVPPFVVPHPDKAGTGKVSAGINTATEYVRMQQPGGKDERESPIGLGYRVPLVIASPWSRGGWVNSEVFDHTSSLQFLEMFLEKKSGKKIQETNISNWRRCICGDLTSVFRPYNGEKINLPKSVEKDAFITTVHKARFKEAPKGWKTLTANQVEEVKQNPLSTSFLPQQEKGIRDSCALPYELYVDGNLSAGKKTFDIRFAAGNTVFGDRSAGAPFLVYAQENVVANKQAASAESFSNRDYAVKAGDRLMDQWALQDFENSLYRFSVYGPNGFFREFTGDKNDPAMNITCGYERMTKNPKRFTGNLVLFLNNLDKQKAYTIDIEEKTYKKGVRTIALKAGTVKTLVLDMANSFHWYDVAVKVRGQALFEQRFAGRVEIGRHGKTDPFMGGMIA